MKAPVTRRLAPLTPLLATLVIALVSAVGGAAGQQAQTARELDAIQGRIRGLEQDISRAAVARPTAGKALQQAEVVEADARQDLQSIRSQQAEGRTREKTLRMEMARAEVELANHQAMLERQLRLAYITGREEWLRLALTQQDPMVLSRRVVYYGYITRQRSALLEQVQGEIVVLGAAATELSAQLAALADIGRRQEARVREVAAARRVRAKAVETLERDLGSSQQKLSRLRREARALEQLMARLARESQAPARRAQPHATPGPAQQVKDLPLRGHAVATFGQPRADGLLRWDGMVLAAPGGTELRAVRAGRVVYADWLPGMGQLLVLDHGKGYMSLYGHNQQLLKTAGQDVRQGEVVARVGDSGGQGNPGLYFEVRRDGKPVNPAAWVR